MIPRLKAFIFAAETLSFSEASKHLQLTQPTISHHIKTLEKNLGVALFERNGNQLILTEAGATLIPWARKLIRQSNEIRELMTAVQETVVCILTITHEPVMMQFHVLKQTHAQQEFVLERLTTCFAVMLMFAQMMFVQSV